MADQKKISALPNAAALADANYLPAVQSGTTVKVLLSAISVYVNGKLPANVSSLANLAGTADQLPYFTGAGALALASVTAYARTLLDDTSASAAQTTLGIPALLSGYARSGANIDITSITGSAAKLTTQRTLAASGDATWSVSFDGSASASAAITLAASGVTAGSYGLVAVDAKGRVTAGTAATPVANGGTGATAAAAARANLGVAFSAWANCTLANSWTLIAGRRAAYRAFLDMVQLEMNIQTGTATDGTVVTTLPVGFRPAFPLVVPVSAGTNTAIGATVPPPRVLIGTDGTVACFNCSNAPGISFSTVFAIV